MIDLNNVQASMQEDIQSVLDWCNEMYNKNYAPFFTRQRELYKRLESKTHPITDEELEDIITSIPLDLFTVSEALDNMKTSHEVIKLRNKQKLNELKKASTATTATQKTEDAEVQMIEEKILDMAYGNLLSRVDHEISFSRELIMGAKKVWDRRRQTENVNPVGTNIASAPAAPEGHKTYYEQMQASKGQPIFGG